MSNNSTNPDYSLFLKSENNYFSEVKQILFNKYSLKIKKSKIEKFLSKKKNKKMSNFVDMYFLKKHSPELKNHFYITDGEFNPDTMKNVFDYDLASWTYQNLHKTHTFQDNYNNLYLNGDWAKWEKADYPFTKAKEVTFGTLLSARSYVLSKITNKLSKILDTKIPRLLLTTHHKLENGNSSMDFDSRCGGFEDEYDNLSSYLHSELTPIINTEINKQLLKYDNYTFAKSSQFPGDDSLHEFLIFGGISAAKNTSFEDFFNDFENLQQPIGLLNQLIKEIYHEYKGPFIEHISNIKNKEK